MTGAFVAVVGPSGSGKDAVLDWARTRLAGSRFLFPRRVITRPSGPGEDHVPVAPEAFAAAEAAGRFALTWRAHGLAYGVPASVSEAIADGWVVVANVSREVLPALEDVFGRAHTVRITVSDEVRRARIAARGRENSADAHARLDRPDPAPGFPVDLEIVNDGTLEDAGSLLVDFLRGVEARTLAR